jgi:hypothetical protein
MMTYLWVYEGELDATERVLTLHSRGPKMMTEGELISYKDVIEFKDADHRVLTSYALGDEGDWQLLMTAHYRRKH